MPELIGREGDDSNNEAPDVASTFGFKERFVPTVVENDEEPDTESGSYDHKRDGEPWGNIINEIHGDPEPDEWKQCVGELPACLRAARLLVLEHSFAPGF